MFELMSSTRGAKQHEYCQLLRRHFRLHIRKVAMKRTLTDQELDASKQYAQVTTQIEAVNTRLDEILGEFDTEDYHAMFRRLDE